MRQIVFHLVWQRETLQAFGDARGWALCTSRELFSWAFAPRAEVLGEQNLLN